MTIIAFLLKPGSLIIVPVMRKRAWQKIPSVSIMKMGIAAAVNQNIMETETSA